MDRKQLAALLAGIVLLAAMAAVIVYLNVPETGEKEEEPEEVEPGTGVGVSRLYIRDRYGCYVHSYLYYPSQWGNLSPPVSKEGGYPAVVFGTGWKVDNSMYEWLGQNLSANGYVSIFIDFVNNSNPWAETRNGRISGLYCDTYGGNASMPPQYRFSNEVWPDVWPWVHELSDAADWLINASKEGYGFHNGNTTVELDGLIDPDRMAVMGHSTGGSMAIVAAMTNKRFKVAAALAPYDEGAPETYWPPYPSDYLGYQRAVPLLLSVGSRDVVTPPSLTSEKIYSNAHDPKMLATILDGNHMYFCDKEDTIRSGIEPPEELPITLTPITVEGQQEAAVNVTVNFLDHYLKPPALFSPYRLSDDLDGDGEDEINKSFEEGKVVRKVGYDPGGDLMYEIFAEVVPRGIGWGNSSVKVVFYDILGREVRAPVVMSYRYGSNKDPLAGMFRCKAENIAYKMVVEARSVDGKEYLGSKIVMIR